MTRLRTLLLLAVLTPALAPAQDLASHPWAAWFGCWAPTSSESTERSVTCVVPAPGAEPAVEVITSVNGVLARRSRIAADGVRVPFDQDGCVGWDAAEFSDDGARVYFSGEVTCGNRGMQVTSGVYAFAPGGEWLDVQVIRTGEQRTMRAHRLELLPLTVLPADVQEDFVPVERVARSARAAALASPLSIAQVIDVAARVDAAAAEIWLIESARGVAKPLQVQRAELVRLAQANVPERVIDAAVAIANPSHFYVDVAAGGGLIAQLAEAAGSNVGSRAPIGSAMGSCGLGVWNDLYFQPLTMFMGMHLPLQYYSRGAASCFDSWFYGRNWFDRSGLGVVVFMPAQPVVPTVMPKSSMPRAGPTRSGGTVVSGSGYRQPRASGTSSGSGTRSSEGTSSGTTSGSSSSSGSSGRTAKPRNPN